MKTILNQSSVTDFSLSVPETISSNQVSTLVYQPPVVPNLPVYYPYWWFNCRCCCCFCCCWRCQCRCRRCWKWF